MDFREYTVVREGREIVVQGTIREPVHWDFTIRMCEDDLPGLTKVALSKATLGYLIRSAFRRRKDSHWSESREEHLAAVKSAAVEAKKKAAEAEAAATGEGEEKPPDRTTGRRTPRRTPAARPGGEGGESDTASGSGAESQPAEAERPRSTPRTTAGSNGSAGARKVPASAARSVGGRSVSFAKKPATPAAEGDADESTEAEVAEVEEGSKP